MGPSGTKYVSFELFLSILKKPGEGKGGGAPGTVPLQNQEVTSRKACLKNAETSQNISLAPSYKTCRYSSRPDMLVWA